MFKRILLFKLIFFSCIFVSFSAYAEKIKDLTSVGGVRDNQLIGYGLIVGLDGTGDQSTQTPFTNQSLYNMLSQLGISVPFHHNMYLRNIAAVMVTAQIPPFSHPGEKIDVVVASLGNARSIKGGTLLMTPLKGVDNQIYALAQGNVIVSEKSHSQDPLSYFHMSQVNCGRINHGATIEKEIYNNFGHKNIINLQLNQEDFRMAQRISDVINIKYPDTAIPINSKTIQISASADNNVQVHMLSKIQNINILMPSPEAKIILNSRTGSVVINKEVKLRPCVISNGKMSIIIHDVKEDIKNLDTLNLSKNIIKNYPTQNHYAVKKKYDFGSANLNNIIRSLNALGTKPDELTSLLQSLKSAGCLNAKLEII